MTFASSFPKRTPRRIRVNMGGGSRPRTVYRPGIDPKPEKLLHNTAHNQNLNKDPKKDTTET